jgi:predicted regulator of Ras-like GTPase activity (Roadblock/LC7/MglB family)
VETILQRLTELDEVLNAILVDKEGLIVAGIMRSEDEEMVGAMSAAAFGSITTVATQARQGEPKHVIIETQHGSLHIEASKDLILVVLTRAHGNHGRIRLEMKKACQQLSQLVASY